MAKRQFKIYFHHGRHVNVARGKRNSFATFVQDVIFGVCYKVGYSVYASAKKIRAGLARDYENTLHVLRKRVVAAKQARLAGVSAIFLFICGIGFAGILGIKVLAQGLELKNQFLALGQRGSKALVEAKTQLQSNDFSSAQDKFLEAYASFTTGREELERQNSLLTQLLNLLPQKKDADKLFQAAALLSDAGADFSKAYENFSQLSITQSGITSAGASAATLPEVTEQAQKAITKVDTALAVIDQVNADSLPHGYKEKLVALKGNFKQLRQAFQSFNDLLSLGAKLTQGNQHILLVLENNNELRPGGGFIGTYGDVVLNDGNIKSLNMSSIYDLDGQLDEKIRPPFPIFAVNDRWFMRDSNWFASWPASAKKISSFYEKEGGETPDTVIAMTPSLVQNLLKLTGPITLPRYGVTLTSDNFVEVTQVESSVTYDRTDNKPKQILADLVPVLLEKVGKTPKDSWPELLRIVQDSLNQKQVVLYSRDSQTEGEIGGFNWSGDIRPSDRDYLAINSANLSGSKTDLFIKQSFSLKSTIADDGSVTNELVITRANTMPNLPDTANQSFIRVLVPKGSQLVSNIGFDYNTMSLPDTKGYQTDSDVDSWEKGIMKDLVSGTSVGEESGKTFFGNWLTVKGGETKTVTLTYKLPFKISKLDRFSLLLQKQIGALPSDFSYELDFPSRSVLWKSFDPSQLGSGKLTHTFTFDRDIIFGEVLATN